MPDPCVGCNFYPLCEIEPCPKIPDVVPVDEVEEIKEEAPDWYSEAAAKEGK